MIDITLQQNMKESVKIKDLENGVAFEFGNGVFVKLTGTQQILVRTSSGTPTFELRTIDAETIVKPIDETVRLTLRKYRSC